MRIAIPANVRKAVYQKYGKQCAKCMNPSTILELHHCVSIIDGGETTAENLIPLCRLCHKEWHTLNSVYEQHIDFSEWLRWPPTVWLVVFMNKPEILLSSLPEDEINTLKTQIRHMEVWQILAKWRLTQDAMSLV